MKPLYTYEVDFEELIPPIGGELRYAAKPVSVYKVLGDKRENVDAPFAEVHGKTKEEAKKKLDEAMQKLIEEQIIF